MTTRGQAPPVRLVLADGQSLHRAGIRTVLADYSDMDIVAEAGDGAAAVELARRLLPDVVLTDVHLPRLSGVAAIREIVAASLPVRVLVLASVDSDDHVVAALRAGARGYLSRDVPPAELVAAVRTVAAGEAVVAPHLLRRLLDRFAAALPDPAAPPAPVLPELTEREREVLVHMARGESNSEIAAALSVSGTTVKTHVGNLLTKLGVRDRVQAVVRAYESGLVRPRAGAVGAAGGVGTAGRYGRPAGLRHHPADAGPPRGVHHGRHD